MLKITHLIAPARFGGLESVVRTLAVGQKTDRDHSVAVVALLETGLEEPPLLPELRSHGVTVVPFAYPARSFRKQRRSVFEVCGRLQPDILHSHGYLPDVLSASLGSRFKPVRVTTVHGFTRGGFRNRLYEWAQRRALTRLDAVVAVSMKLAKDLRSPDRQKRIHTLPNAWAPSRPFADRNAARQRLGIQPDAFIIGWVGRLSPEKGPDILLEAIRELEIPGLHVVFVGDGSERQRLQAKTTRLRIQERVMWMGEVANASDFLPAFDLFVNSSRSEGTPITVLEAMNAGVPIVATAVGGVPEVLSSAEALLISAEDPAALAAAIRQVHIRPSEANARADRARERVQSIFTTRPWIDAYDRIYFTALACKNKR